MRYLMIGLLLVLCQSQALADRIFVYSAGTETLTLSFRDDQHIRVDRSGGDYSVINGARAVAVIKQGNGNLVLDVDQVAGMLGELTGNQAVSIPDSGTVRLTDTGERRQVAGFSGRVYEVSDGKGSYRLVLSNHPEVIVASDAIRHFFRRFARALGNEQGARILALDHTFRDHPYRGVLHVEGGVKLVSIGQLQRPDGFYAIPANSFNFSIPGLTY